MKANHNAFLRFTFSPQTVSKIVKSQNESKSQQGIKDATGALNCVKDR